MKSLGDAKWIIWPIGYKVRLRKGPFTEVDWPADIDYAGYDALTNILKDMRYIDDDNNDLEEYSLEALDPDWRTSLLDFFHDLHGTHNYCCEKDGSIWNPELELSVRKAERKWLMEHNPKAFDENGKLEHEIIRWEDETPIYDSRLFLKPTDSDFVEWTGDWCRTHSRGKVIQAFMMDFRLKTEWIETHLKVKESKRGKNPNSLKNLKHFKVDVVNKKESGKKEL